MAFCCPPLLNHSRELPPCLLLCCKLHTMTSLLIQWPPLAPSHRVTGSVTVLCQKPLQIMADQGFWSIATIVQVVPHPHFIFFLFYFLFSLWCLTVQHLLCVCPCAPSIFGFVPWEREISAALRGCTSSAARRCSSFCSSRSWVPSRKGFSSSHPTGKGSTSNYSVT